MGLHESQSRFWENHVGRSRAAAPWLLSELRAAFGEIGVTSPEALFRAVNRVEPGFIRTAADELQYDLHVLMRFDLERALLSGDLPPEDLPAAWDDRFEADFARRPPDAARGCLQDVHWSEGLIGYFPTYSLGNLAAAQLADALHRERPGLADAFAQGEFAEALAWLRPRIHARARTAPAAEILAGATGAAAGWDEGPLLAHLEAKFAPA
jgi:Zn-dependent carboxypeptidase